MGAKMRTPTEGESALERLADTNPELEVWWDSSPLIFAGWAQGWLARQGADRPLREAQLSRFFGGPAEARVICGVTTNPPLCKQVLDSSPQVWREFAIGAAASRPGVSSYEVFWETYREIVRRGAAMVMEVFESSGQRRGYLSGQVDPRQLHDTEAMVAQAKALKQASPNVMIKMPGTKEGIDGIRRLTALGIATNATLTFTVSQLVAVAEAVRAGLEEAKRNGVDLSQWRSVGTLMLGRFEDAKEFRRQAEERGILLSEEDLRWAGIAVFKRVCQTFAERGYPTKPLAASMRLGPTLDGRVHVWHIEKIAGAPAVFTIFPNIIEAFLEEYDSLPLESQFEREVPREVIEKLSRLPYFLQAYEEGGLAPVEFVNYPATVETAHSFSRATEEMIGWVEGVLADREEAPGVQVGW